MYIQFPIQCDANDNQVQVHKRAGGFASQKFKQGRIPYRFSNVYSDICVDINIYETFCKCEIICIAEHNSCYGCFWTALDHI